jgi:hypothetical protein
MLNFFLQLIEDILNETTKLSQKDKDFVYDQVSYALKQTQSHINSTRANGKDKSSSTLSNVWQRASKQIKTVSNSRIQNLAETIEEKSKYWADPDGYDTTHFESFQMRISQVELTLKELCK